MILGILAVMTVAGTAFAVYMRERNKASVNVANLAQAEMAARSGLEHAIAAIEHCLPDYRVSANGAVLKTDGSFHNTTHDVDSGWLLYFDGATQIIDFNTSFRPALGDTKDMEYPLAPLPQKRGDYTVMVEDLDSKLHAEIMKFASGAYPSPPPSALYQALSTANIQSYSTLIEAESLRDPFASQAEMARRIGVYSYMNKKYDFEHMLTVYPPSSTAVVKPCEQAGSVVNAAPGEWVITLKHSTLNQDEHIGMSLYVDAPGRHGSFLILDNDATTVTVLAPASPASIDEDPLLILYPRPAIKINTVSESLLAALIRYIPGFYPDTNDPGNSPGDKPAALAKYLCQKRPFVDRHEFEDAVHRVSGIDSLDELPIDTPDPLLPYKSRLTERQFNDVLNNFAPVFPSTMLGPERNAESVYDDPSHPGIYSFDGWPPYNSPDPFGPSQVGGDHSNRAGTLTNSWDDRDNVTWSTEVSFTSPRFFHIYVLGRAWNEETNQPSASRRLHAIYDADVAPDDPLDDRGKIIWMRWNLSERGTVSDYVP